MNGGTSIDGLQLVDSVGAVRRVQALVAIGWSLTSIAARLTTEPSRLSQLVHGRTPSVTIARYRAICKLYNELWNRLPPVTTSRDAASFRRARRLAAANEWLSPLAWDDATIDDPGAKPNRGSGYHVVVDEIAIEQAMQGHRVPLTREERAEAVQRLVQKGWSGQQIAATLQISTRTVERARHRGHGFVEERAA